MNSSTFTSIVAVLQLLVSSTARSATVCDPGEIAVGYQNSCIYGHCDAPVGQLWDSECNYIAAATTLNSESNDCCFVDWDSGANVTCIDNGYEYLPVYVDDGQGSTYGNCRDVDLEDICGYDPSAEPYEATQINFCCPKD